MDDREIIALFNERSESAIGQAKEKYSEYCFAIAHRIVQNDETAWDCVDDTFLRAWNTIPPCCPPCLRTYLGRIVRHVSADARDRLDAQKRGGGEMPVLLGELSECVESRDCTEAVVDELVLQDILDRFLHSLSKQDQWIFVHRYWHTDSIAHIAEQTRLTEGTVKMRLQRMRKKLKQRLIEEGVMF